ncbi:MAG: hypothetical protein H7A25_26040 [Leptospiraceae bacterium]|nr:hypothetical protein [Leptospiraceae bacterium]MCP5503387.1 hypothetical protein [Leptospiraceae bacterium]
MQESIYQSILNHLSLIPVEYLDMVDSYLKKLALDAKAKEQNRQLILNLAGSWSDMSEEDFEDYLEITKNTRDEMFQREINL